MKTIVWERVNKFPQIIVNEEGDQGLIMNDNVMDMDMWLGHTNFPLTQGIMDDIGEVDGVEHVTDSSRYRFVLAIGKAFSSSHVKDYICKKLCCNVSSINSQFLKLKGRCSENPNSAGLLLPNGRTVFLDKNNSRLKNLLFEVKNISRGVLIEPK